MRNYYVLMFLDNGVPMFCTARRKRDAVRHARQVQATVYAIPYDGTSYDCPTIRVLFDPIFKG